MSQVKNMLIEIADEAADITLDNCPGRGLPFSLQVSGPGLSRKECHSGSTPRQVGAAANRSVELWRNRIRQE
jgi:hypothetical protein